MKTKSQFALILILILSACSPALSREPFVATPAPVINTEGYEAVQVDHVQVEVGVGSPIPVHVIASGNLPDICAQIELIQVMQDESNFDITLSTLPTSDRQCIRDSLPFKISLPLNVIGLPAGTYTVDLNGSRGDFELNTVSVTSDLPTVDSAFYKDDIQVDSVNIEIGKGSPIPVHAIVSLNLPNSCAQLGEVRLHRDGKTFFVRLVAYVIEGQDCQADSIPFRLEVPLNIVNLPKGTYEVNVNGVTASFDPSALPAKP